MDSKIKMFVKIVELEKQSSERTANSLKVEIEKLVVPEEREQASSEYGYFRGSEMAYRHIINMITEYFQD
jgi:hypothetical protein